MSSHHDDCNQVFLLGSLAAYVWLYKRPEYLVKQSGKAHGCEAEICI